MSRARLKSPSTKLVLYAALTGNLLVAAAKAAAAGWTGSSAMASEAIHSFVDSLNELVLLYGIRRSKRPPDTEHPMGHGRELYFWSFIVALLVFSLGAVATFYEGVSHILHPEPIRNPFINYLVLTFAFAIDGATWLISLREFIAAKGALSFYEAFRRSKDPPSFIVLFEDSAALLGLFVAAIGTSAAVAFRQPMLDGVASIVIGLILAGTAMLVARESKSLLIGERADPSLMKSILEIAASEPGVSGANGLLTAQLGPDQVVVAVSIEFADDLRTAQIEEQVVALEQKVRAAHPSVIALFVKPQTNKTFRAAQQTQYRERP